MADAPNATGQVSEPVYIVDGNGNKITSLNPLPTTGGGGGGTTPSSTATVTSVAASATSVTLIAANTGRLGPASVYYDGAASLYVHAGTGAASASSFTVRLGASGLYLYEAPTNFTGTITGIWSAATGAATVTDWTA